MSDNRTTLQQHNIRINENNSDLSSILEEINNLPLVDVPILQDKNVVPTTETQEIVADDGYTGLSKVTVAGDENLVAENIKKDVEIFGVVGSAEGGNAEVKINDGRYLFYRGARTDYLEYFLSLCEELISTEYMFAYCSSLESIDVSNFDTSNVTNMSYMFMECPNLKSIDVSNFDTSNVTNMSYMFYGCRNLTELDLRNFETSNVTTMQSMFTGCTGMNELNLNNFDTSNVTDVQNMFFNCSKIVGIDVGNCDASKVRSLLSFFKRCYKLTNLKFFKNFGKGYTSKTTNNSSYKIDFSDSKELTHESLQSVKDGLYDLNLTYDVANGGTLYTQQLIVGSENVAKYTAEEIAEITAKGWTVS